MFLVCSLVMGVLIVGLSCLGWFSGAEETFPWKINFDTSLILSRLYIFCFIDKYQQTGLTQKLVCKIP